MTGIFDKMTESDPPKVFDAATERFGRMIADDETTATIQWDEGGDPELIPKTRLTRYFQHFVMFEEPLVLKTGERVMIECDGRSVEGVVELASGNGKSVFITYEAILDGCVGGMPLTHFRGNSFFNPISLTPVKLTVIGA
jgi:hypothetical protein